MVYNSCRCRVSALHVLMYDNCLDRNANDDGRSAEVWSRLLKGLMHGGVNSRKAKNKMTVWLNYLFSCDADLFVSSMVFV